MASMTNSMNIRMMVPGRSVPTWENLPEGQDHYYTEAEFERAIRRQLVLYIQVSAWIHKPLGLKSFSNMRN
jgi:hypothetical protein